MTKQEELLQELVYMARNPRIRKVYFDMMALAARKKSALTLT